MFCSLVSVHRVDEDDSSADVAPENYVLEDAVVEVRDARFRDKKVQPRVRDIPESLSLKLNLSRSDSVQKFLYRHILLEHKSWYVFRPFEQILEILQQKD